MTEIRICARIPPMRSGASFDVLVVGSGASGLAAAVSAERAGARVGARDEDDAAGVQLGEGAGRHPGRRSARTTRPRSTPRTSCARHDTANPRLVEVLTSEAPSAIHWLEELGVEFTRVERRLPPRALRRRDAAAAAPGRRPHRARDHEGASRGVRGRRGAELPHHALRAIAPGRTAGSPRSRRRRAAPRSRPAPSSSPPAGAASRRRRRAASSRRTIPTRPAR